MLACTIACALAPAKAADFEATIYFGDSLTDSGTFGARFTTNPGPVWAQLLSSRLGLQAAPAIAGGTNYAVGGARVTLLPGVPNAAPTSSATPIGDQIGAYLGASAVQSGGLYTVWGGANDVFVAASLGAGGPAYLTQSAGELAAQVGRLQAAGARYLLVPNLPDIGATPFGVSQGPAGAAGLTQLSAGFNRDLYAAIAARGIGVIALDTFGLLTEVMANPGLYGFANVTLPACGATPSLACTPADLVDPDAPQTFLFADGVHPTTAGHSVLADYAASTITGPVLISQLPESALQTRRALVDRLYVQMLDAARGRNVWITIDGQRSSFEDLPSGGGAGVTLGADLLRRPGLVLGAALGLAQTKPQSYEQNEVNVSLYGGWRGGAWRASGALGYGALEHDVKRDVRLGAATRTASGSTGGSNLSAGLEAGYQLGSASLAHGPFAGVLAQRVKVDGFTEDGAGSANLRYGEQRRSSTLGRLGYQATYHAGWWQPYARVSLDRELRDDERDVQAQVASQSDMPMYSVPAVAPGRSFATLLIGSRFRVAEGWSANLGVSQVASQSRADWTGAFATLSAEF